MGSVSLKIGDGTAKFKRSTICSSGLNIVMLISVLITNLFALYAFTSPPLHLQHPTLQEHKNITVISEHVSLILREIGAAQKKLSQMQKELSGYESLDFWAPNIPGELKLYLQPQTLPLGKDSKMGITEMVASIGHPCSNSLDLLARYMNYKVGQTCPDDWDLAQKLMLRGCEPLPRRRCLSRPPAPKVELLLPFPASLWKPVADKVVSWSRYRCKSFQCLNARKGQAKPADDCVDCFDIVKGVENQRWIKAMDRNDFVVDDVLALGNGGIRIGLDVGGGTGTFAARMAERNVTVITSTLNLNAPFNEFVAARGLFPLFLTLGQRFPFFDGTFDLVHTMHLLSDWIPVESMEFLMFDIDRVLRAGGLLWLDKFFCAEEELKKTYVGLIEKFGYKKLKWVVGPKGDASATGRTDVYLSAVLQKPPRA
ncbi:probable methyltransferase At1g29790 [Nymphaea colorata]|uniref:Methyltransferase type 11 domain-containing protein n=1 Tax=Nymphaea colorata TaxID=210225 RepID=A0A5K1GQB5_9MAGN|nr:probable methyltransferase At1g29790 [Nymphaea colorata]